LIIADRTLGNIAQAAEWNNDFADDAETAGYNVDR
jgi:hypothetical protein